MKSLIKIVNQLGQCLKKQQELTSQKKHYNQLIPQEEARLKQEAYEEEETLKRRIEQTKNEVYLELSTVLESAKIAHQVTQEEEKLFKQECQDQGDIISNLSGLIDESDPKLSDSPPRLLSLTWNDPRWTPFNNENKNINGYKPQVKGLAPGILCIGELLIEQVEPIVRVPALIPIRCLSNNSSQLKNGHLAIFSSDTESRQVAIRAIESIALRVIATFPLRRLKGIFIDPVGMGNSFPFKNLHPFISGQKTYTRSDDIREQLRELTEHIEQVIQNYLGKNYRKNSGNGVDRNGKKCKLRK
jgi:hypothetical protein